MCSLRLNPTRRDCCVDQFNPAPNWPFLPSTNAVFLPSKVTFSSLPHNNVKNEGAKNRAVAVMNACCG
jgi:hypothetical protein